MKLKMEILVVCDYKSALQKTGACLKILALVERV